MLLHSTESGITHWYLDFDLLFKMEETTRKNCILYRQILV